MVSLVSYLMWGNQMYDCDVFACIADTDSPCDHGLSAYAILSI